MTKDEVKAKWAVAKRMIALTDDEKNCNTAEDCSLAVIKTKLQIAISYLSQLDEHGSKYNMPFTGNQMKWALAKPTANDKVQKATEWCHQCYLLREEAYPKWNREEKTA
ncbi:hypothetical protein H5S09_02820 [Limosilactobacillus sp. STM2_1]|uniref:Uncharacterized protein n=1 Tax=Limosilactobacillus rudii TaxID=2759755 RepID=A0A7W3UJQ9_9LACO|nr:hypothetical protein [Limosilactobacillus rudii]MBB1080213.1 hypothetical protein [Limosilactobacillus rudii]MBB1096883.1 hypothetical protein [Limosilactobacillus rudii]MCD7133781.1 hypothetical protein [Limosilactobacillus rudii]